MSPQQKRMRRDWDDHGGDLYHGGYDLGYGGGGGPSYAPPQPWGHPEIHLMQPHHAIPIQARLGNIHDLDLGPPPPVMKTFKEFLLSLDDSVDETESVKRYNEYKIDFRRQQMQEFFLAHKGEEWFRSKYHPDDSGKRKAEAHAALQNRLGSFQYLMENSWFENISMDIDRAPQILTILDAAVIKMEGGTENDLRILEQQPLDEEEERERLSSGGPPSENQKRDGENRGAESERKASAEKDNKEGESGDLGMKDVDGEAGDEESKPDEETTPEEISLPKKLGKKRKRKHNGDSEDEASASESESESDSDSNSHCSEKPAEGEGEPGGEGDERNEEGEEKEDEEGEDTKGRKEEKQSEKEEKKVKDDQPPKPRPLDMTCSLFMRSIALSISKAEIVALCRRYPGFMRVCLSEPQPERRFFRRCWVTFDCGVNIKEICWIPCF